MADLGPPVSHILIVEDDRDIAELVRHYLVRAGYTAEVLVSGDRRAGARAASGAPTCWFST